MSTAEGLGRLTWTVPEVAAALGVSTRHIYNKVADGTLDARPLGGRVLIPKESLERWLRGEA